MLNNNPPKKKRKILKKQYIYIYIYISEVGGKGASAEPNREIGFGFVSCSCRACVRASEAKLREHARGDISSVAGGLIWKMYFAGGDLLPHRCDAIRKGFKQKTIGSFAKRKGSMH